MTETFFVMAVSKMLYGEFPAPGKMILFCLLLGIFAIGAPGVPGGTVMASLGLITGVLGFDENGTALMLTIFALQDSFHLCSAGFLRNSLQRHRRRRSDSVPYRLCGEAWH